MGTERRYPHHQRRPRVMDLLTKTLLNGGDTVLCRGPSFIRFFEHLPAPRAKLVGIPMEETASTQKLEEALNREKNVAYLYTIPNFKTSGITWRPGETQGGEPRAVPGITRLIVLEDNLRRPFREDVPSIKSPSIPRAWWSMPVPSQSDLPPHRVGYAIGPKGGPAKDGGVCQQKKKKRKKNKGNKKRQQTKNKEK